MVQELRNSPRQSRSQHTVDAILDAAGRLVERDGKVDFTASELAEAAHMSIGRVYYWFIDMQAVVAALVDRSANRFAAVFGQAVTGQRGVTTPLLLERAITEMCTFIDQNPACVTLCTSGGAHRPGQALFDQIVRFATDLTIDRVPHIPMEEVDLVARTATGVALGMLNHYMTAGPARPLVRQELIYVLSAYLYARFPPANDLTWTDGARGVQPAWPSRTDFTESAIVWPALAPDAPSTAVSPASRQSSDRTTRTAP